MKRNLLEQFRATRLEAGERILAWERGGLGDPRDDAANRGVGLLILTDRRLVFLSRFLFRDIFEELGLSGIYDVEQRTVLGEHVLEFKTLDGTLVFRSASRAGRDELLNRTVALLPRRAAAPRPLPA